MVRYLRLMRNPSDHQHVHLWARRSEAESFWRAQIKDEVKWLHHGTSSHFVPAICRDGLRPGGLPPGTLRARRFIQKTFAACHPRSYMLLDSGAIHLSANTNVTADAVSELPAFLYEVLDERNTLGNVPNGLMPRDRRRLTASWRLGRILRRSNRLVIVHVRVDSAFLIHLGVPDVLSDFSAWYELCASNESTPLPDLLTSLGHALDRTPAFLRYHYWKDDLALRAPIPASFIYLDRAEGTAGESSRVSAKDWSPSMPLVVAHGRFTVNTDRPCEITIDEEPSIEGTSASMEVQQGRHLMLARFGSPGTKDFHVYRLEPLINTGEELVVDIRFDRSHRSRVFAWLNRRLRGYADDGCDVRLTRRPYHVTWTAAPGTDVAPSTTRVQQA